MRILFPQAYLLVGGVRDLKKEEIINKVISNKENKQKKWDRGTSLKVQWLRLHVPNARGSGSIPGQGTRSHILQLGI